MLNQGFYRSDDGGASWQQSTKDPRITGSEYFSRIFVDPNNPDGLYVAQTSLYRSTDGGHTFEAYVGVPSGDDFHVLWIDPQDSARMLLGVDQGAIISVDGGATGKRNARVLGQQSGRAFSAGNSGGPESRWSDT